MRTRHLFLVAAVSLGLVSAAAAQDNFPSRAIRIVIPFTAGTGSDTIARAMAPHLSQALGVPVTVDNREGASGMIGTQYVAKSPPDGYTVTLAATNMVTTSFVTEPPPYSPTKDFVTLGQIATIPMVFMASPTGPYQGWMDVVNAAKANPGKLNYATSGKMGTSHLFTEEVMKSFGFKAKDVHYKNAGQAVIDTSQGQPDFLLSNIPIASGMLQSGKIRAIAVGSTKRLASMPTVPTLAELMGNPNYSIVLWYGWFAPAGTPPAVQAKLYDAIQKAMAAPDVRARIAMNGGEVDIKSPEYLAKVVAADTEKYGKLISELGLNKP